jgi:hypothetical protein
MTTTDRPDPLVYPDHRASRSTDREPRSRAGRADIGKADHEPHLVLLIGVRPESSLIWTNVQPLLLSHGLTVCTIDRPGYPAKVWPGAAGRQRRCDRADPRRATRLTGSHRRAQPRDRDRTSRGDQRTTPRTRPGSDRTRRRTTCGHCDRPRTGCTHHRTRFELGRLPNGRPGAILSGQTADLPNGVQRYPRPLEARVARALATGSV